MINNVNELIRLGKGDLGRLGHIKNTLESNRALYTSDKKYVEELVSKYMSSKNQPDPKEPLEEKYDENRISDTSEVIFCWKCGASSQSNQNFCSKCGASKTSEIERIIDNGKLERKHSGIRSYQILSIIGGVLGLIATLAYFALFSFTDAFISSFGNGFDESTRQYISTAVPIAILIFISCFIIPFVIKKTKTVGMYLIISSFVVLISTSYVGIIGFALLLPAGILALRSK